MGRGLARAPTARRAGARVVVIVSPGLRLILNPRG